MYVERVRKSGICRRILSIFIAILLAFSGLLAAFPSRVSAAGEEILIEPASWGVVTAKELNSFKAFIRTRPLPTTNVGNNMVWGGGAGSPGTDTESLGIMYELTEDKETLDLMIQFVDEMLKNRNDPVTGRIIFTGNRELCWPNKAETDPDATYAGPENGNIIMHIANCAKSILKTPALWNTTVAAGDPYGYGATYKERALKYIEELDKTVEDFIVPNFVDYTKDVNGLPKLYFPLTDGFKNAKHASPDHPGRPIPWNQQMLLNNGFMALAECHELLGNKPDRVAQYDLIVDTSVKWFISQLTPYDKDGHEVYVWNYWPDDSIPSSKIEDAGDAHASNDIMGLYRAYLRGKYNIPKEVMAKIADTLNYVVWDDQKQMFNFKVDGSTPSSESMKRVLWSEWIPAAEFNIDTYNKIVNDDWLNIARSGALYAARTMWMEKRLKDLKISPPPRPEKPATVPKDPNIMNLALGKASGASSSWSTSYGADKAFDGMDTSTSRWSSKNLSKLPGYDVEEWIYVDLGESTTFNNVVLKEYINSGDINLNGATTRIQAYKLQSSDDGVVYNDIPSTEGTTIGSEKVIYFATVTSRFVRLYISDTASYSKSSKTYKREPGLYEFEVYNMPTISPAEGKHDLKLGMPENLMFRLAGNGRTLNSISNGSYSLIKDRDFTAVAESVYSSVYTITNEYLMKVPVGEYTLNFDFDTGNDATMKLSIMDTSPILNKSEIEFDKNIAKQSDISIPVTHNGNTLLEIYDNSNSLREGREYTSVAESVYTSTYTFKKDYLSTLPLGVNTLVIDFDYGKSLNLDINVYDSTSAINISSAEFDKNVAKQADILIIVSTKGRDINAINNGSYILNEAKDYTVTTDTYSAKYNINKVFLKSLPLGENQLVFDFDKGDDSVFKVIVKDTTPNTNTTGTVASSVQTNPTPVISVTKDGLNITGAQLNSSTKTASVQIDASKLDEAYKAAKEDAVGVKTITVNVEKVAGALSYEVKLPAAGLAENSSSRQLELKTEAATILVPSNMLKAEELGKASTVSLTVTAVNSDALSEAVKNTVGSRPIISLDLKVDGVSKKWDNKNAPVKVVIPYKPTIEELKNPENLVVWYLNESGDVVPVYNSRFVAPDKMIFTTSHFSQYAVAFNIKTFTDISSYEWAKKQIEVLAAKGIIQGVSSTEFSPAVDITRADFVTLLIKTLNLSATIDSNFEDVSKSDYYYEAVGTAKKLGITSGVGSNKFNPNDLISRQDMMTIAAKALAQVKKLDMNGTVKDIESFDDAYQIAAYALPGVASLYKTGLISGDENNLKPDCNATRAEVAVFLYRILNKFLN